MRNDREAEEWNKTEKKKVVKDTKKVCYHYATMPCSKHNVFKCDKVCVGACEEKVMDSLAINGTVISNEGLDIQTRALL